MPTEFDILVILELNSEPPMNQEKDLSKPIVSANKKQIIFIRLFTAVLIDLVVLNVFDEFWENVIIKSFTISLLAALLLQILLKITIRIEHRISAFFDALSGRFYKVLKIISLWAVLFGSKFFILWVIDIAFGNEVLFLGPVHGVITFIVVIVVMLAAESIVARLTRKLG